MATENSYLNSLKAQKDGVIKLLGGITMHLYIYIRYLTVLTFPLVNTN